MIRFPLRVHWKALGLVRQFCLGAAIVLHIGMFFIGWWVADRISRDVTENTAQAAALYMVGIIGPLVQDMSTADRLAPDVIEQLDALVEQTPIREQVRSMLIWSVDGTVVYSTRKDMIGRKVGRSEGFKKAQEGELAAEFGAKPHLGDDPKQATGYPLLEIYSPVRASDSLKIIAVAEFYANGEELQSDLRSAKTMTWVVVFCVTLLMFGALAIIVYGGSITIEQQRAQLHHQVNTLEKLLHENEDLGSRLKQAHLHLANIHEQVLQRIGADLHDGPAQLLAYALLRLSRVSPGSSLKSDEEIARIRSALSDTLSEVRDLSGGLLLPQLATASLGETIHFAVSRHEEHTGSSVACSLGTLPSDVPYALKACIYRFVQEALSNAFRHADGRGQRVSADADDTLVITVSDEGDGFANPAENPQGLGMIGMRARIEALGGVLIVEPNAKPGARLTARFRLTDHMASDAQ